MLKQRWKAATHASSPTVLYHTDSTPRVPYSVHHVSCAISCRHLSMEQEFFLIISMWTALPPENRNTPMCAGMTGSGKTYSMSELSSQVFAHLYQGINQRKARDPSLVVSVTCSYAELYNEVLKDLLSGPTPATGARPLAIRETSAGGVKGLYVKGLSEHVCHCLEVRTTFVCIHTATCVSRPVSYVLCVCVHVCGWCTTALPVGGK